MMELPKHNISLCIMHNEHKSLYCNIVDYIGTDEDECSHYDDFKNDEQRERSIRTNEIWQMQWYPDTPVGSYAIAAPTLEELLEFSQAFKESEV